MTKKLKKRSKDNHVTSGQTGGGSFIIKMMLVLICVNLFNNVSCMYLGINIDWVTCDIKVIQHRHKCAWYCMSIRTLVTPHQLANMDLKSKHESSITVVGNFYKLIMKVQNVNWMERVKLYNIKDLILCRFRKPSTTKIFRSEIKVCRLSARDNLHILRTLYLNFNVNGCWLAGCHLSQEDDWCGWR